MSPEQQRILNIDSDVPTLVKGGPGTGKSTLALYRVERLIKSGVKKILFTTHTNTLVECSQQLLHSLLRRPPQELGVEVDIVDNIARKYYTEANGEPIIAPNEQLLLCLKSAISSVELRPEHLKKINELGSSYLLEEILMVIEARGIENRTRYRETPRWGRKHPLRRNIRDAIWSIYRKWQELLDNAGLISIEQLRRKALEIVVDQMKDKPKPYDAIIIDEAQDLSPVTLKFLAQLVSSYRGLYLTADTQQSLYQRSFSWDHIQANIKFTGKTHILRRSFRNTSQIGKACVEILESMEINNFSNSKGEKPSIILTDDLREQSRLIRQYFEKAAQNFRLPLYSSGVILTPSSDYGKLLAHYLNYNNTPAEYIESQDINLSKRCIKILNLYSAKGLEFPFVVVVGLQEGLLPKSTEHIPAEDHEEFVSQEHRLFYVGCTRAMQSLLVIGSQSSPSRFIKPLISNPFWQLEAVQ